MLTRGWASAPLGLFQTTAHTRALCQTVRADDAPDDAAEVSHANYNGKWKNPLC
jgi:hypothetical protein